MEQERAEAREDKSSIDKVMGDIKVALEQYEEASSRDTAPLDSREMLEKMYQMKPFSINAAKWVRELLQEREQLIAENERLRKESKSFLMGFRQYQKAKVEQDKEIQKAEEALELLMKAHTKRGAALTAACGDNEAVIAARKFLNRSIQS